MEPIDVPIDVSIDLWSPYTFGWMYASMETSMEMSMEISKDRYYLIQELITTTFPSDKALSNNSFLNVVSFAEDKEIVAKKIVIITNIFFIISS